MAIKDTYLSTSSTYFTLTTAYEEGNMIISTSDLRKLRCRKAKDLPEVTQLTRGRAKGTILAR